MAVVSQPETSPGRTRPPGRRRRWTLRAGLTLAAAAVAVAGVAVRAAEPAAGSLPELVRTKHRVFSIPFRLPAAQTADAAPQRVVLNVSSDLGVTWTKASEVAPNANAFSYRAEADGEYWFQLRAIDAQGRSRGGAGPDIRVLVDAAGPSIAARVWKGADGEIICRYAAIDDSLRLESLAVEYRVQGDQGWKKLPSEAILSRESPAHLVGEEIWWAGEKVDALTLRISISDSSGNNTVRQFTLEPNDPQVDQAALARELGAPPLPSQPSATPATPAPVANGTPPVRGGPAAARSVLAAVSNTASPPARGPEGWAAEPATAWPADSPPGIDVGATGAGPTFAAAPAATAAASPGRPPSEYRGKPLQLVRSRRFAWAYDYPQQQVDAGPMRVELWSTRDGGVTWQRTAVDDDGTSPIQVALPAAGLYGFRLDVLPDLPDIAGGPQPGEAPDCWLGVDDEPPTVELIEVVRARPGEPVGMTIRYAANDQMLVPESVRIAYSPHAEGPWTTLAEGLATQGDHRWQPTRAVPSRVHIRVEATDAAGNVGFATSSGPVLVVTPRVVGKLGGVTTLPAEAQP